MVCFSTSAVYERTYEYLFDVYFPEIKYDRVSESFKDKEKCQYFSIITTGNKKRISNDYKNDFEFVKSKSFGRVEVWVLTAKEEFLQYVPEEDEIIRLREKDDEEIQSDLKESLEKEYENITEKFEKVKEGEIVEKKSKPERKERVLWKEVLGD
jgi:hypothetical protein